MRPNFHLSISVKSIETSVQFFVDTLTATIKRRDQTGSVNIDLFGAQITLKEDTSVDPESLDFHFGVNLDLAAFDGLAKNISEKSPGCITVQPKTIDANTPVERKKMFIKCPTGYLIELKGYK